MSDFLPEELIQEILYKLPIKSLVQCTRLCKSWNSLIKSRNFISKHLHRTISSTDHQSLFLLRLCSKQREEQYSLRFDDQDFNEHMQLHFPFKSCESYYRIIGSCNGLICLANIFKTHTISFILWNPLANFQSSVRFHIWVMKEYGVMDSWTKLMLAIGAQGKGIPRALGIRKEDFLMEMKRGWIVSGDLESQQQLTEPTIVALYQTRPAVSQLLTSNLQVEAKYCSFIRVKSA
ncbi:unnamed protein product [Dovyalis caffra]|uniref:F-box domain-containing protein n=1 Tax=Dovyalis caffra TaxID=77055 RepID=A0AAV1R3L4_9ROSI|nr:unnamed protein product [Dovyalis caffra]